MITGTVHRLGDDVDTDAILPGRYLALKDPAALAAHCLEALDPGFRARVGPGDIIAAGRNFGTGSSREHAVIALKSLGIRAIVATSVARIFFRNAINLGLVVLVAPDADLVAGAAACIDGSAITQSGRTWHAAPLGAEVTAILAAGGLMEKIRADLRNTATVRKELAHG